MPILQADVQYGDFVGEAAADREDQRDISALLSERGLIGKEERVAAVEFYRGMDRPSIYAYVVPLTVGDEMPTKDQIRQVDLDLSLDEFFNLFKRFSIVVQLRSANMIGAEYDEAE